MFPPQDYWDWGDNDLHWEPRKNWVQRAKCVFLVLLICVLIALAIIGLLYFLGQIIQVPSFTGKDLLPGW